MPDVEKALLDIERALEELLFAEDNESKIKRLFLLAFLDAMGYAHRTLKSIEQLFPQVLSRLCYRLKVFFLSLGN